MGNLAAARALIGRVGPHRLTVLALLMLLSSLTEGIGLLMLVPLTLAIVGEAGGGGVDWLAALAGLSPALLLSGFVALIGLRALIVYAANERRRRLGLSLTRELRQSVHQAILEADWRWLSGQHSGDHAGMMMGEADRAGILADRGLTILTYTLTLLVLLITSGIIAPALTLAVVGLGLLALWPIWWMRQRRVSDEHIYAQAYLDLQRLVTGGLEHLRAARIGRGTSQFEQNFVNSSVRLEQLELAYFRAGNRIHALYQIVAAALLALFIYLALFDWQTPLAVIVPALALSARAVPMIGGLQQAMRGWHHARPALNNILALIEEARSHAEPSAADLPPVPFARAIELQDITLNFPGRHRPVLQNFDLTIPAGSIVSISGSSGAGKSSLADILSGLIAPDQGTITVDGRMLDDAMRVSWRKQVAYVEQRPFFIDGSIADNLAGDDVSINEERMHVALDAASAGFVCELPDGLHTHIGEGARQLSGGERQRIALARALLCSPDLLILDEVTSGLDPANADAVRRSIAALRGNMTVIALSHDPAMAALADTQVELGGG